MASSWRPTRLVALPLLLLATVTSAQDVTTECPRFCDCESDPKTIDCGGKLKNKGIFDTIFSNGGVTTYDLSNNGLTGVASGCFDYLPQYIRLKLEGNHWDCGCAIDYLRGWMVMQKDRGQYKQILCDSPAHLRGRVIAYLGPDEVTSSCLTTCSTTAATQGLAYGSLLIHGALALVLALVVRRVKAARVPQGQTEAAGGPGAQRRPGGGGDDEEENPYAPVDERGSHTYDWLSANDGGKAGDGAGKAKQRGGGGTHTRM